MLKFVESLDREVKDHDTDDFATSTPPEVTMEIVERMDSQMSDVVALKTKECPFWTVKNLAGAEIVSGIAAWVNLLRSFRGNSANRSQQLAEVHHMV